MPSKKLPRSGKKKGPWKPPFIKEVYGAEFILMREVVTRDGDNLIVFKYLNETYAVRTKACAARREAKAEELRQKYIEAYGREPGNAV